MLSQCLIPSLTRKVITYSLVLGQEHTIFIKLLQYILKSIEIFPIQNYYTVMSKNTNEEKLGQILI